MKKFIFELTRDEIEMLCEEHTVHNPCTTCPLMIVNEVCAMDLHDMKKLLQTLLKEIDVNDYIRMDKTEVGDKGESGERK